MAAPSPTAPRGDEPPLREEEGCGGGDTEDHRRGLQHGGGARPASLRRLRCRGGLTACALRRCPQQVQRLQKRKAFTQQKINNEIKTAKELSRQKNKRGAMMALKKKKLYEKARRRPLAGGAERERRLTP